MRGPPTRMRIRGNVLPRDARAYCPCRQRTFTRRAPQTREMRCSARLSALTRRLALLVVCSADQRYVTPISLADAACAGNNRAFTPQIVLGGALDIAEG
jgi:hypothetical protein